jgi:hypothetical protein
MVRSEPAHLPSDPPATPYRLITGLAAGASNRQLWILLGSDLVAGTGILLAFPLLWPLAAAAGTFASISAWGLLAHHASSIAIRGVQVFLVVIGSLLAVAAMLALFFGILGPRWML